MDLEELTIAVCLGGLIAAAALAFALVPYSLWQQAGIVQQALNRDCGTNYSQRDVFWAGDSLQELCKMREQRLTIKGEQ